MVGFSTRSKIYIAGHTGLIGSSLTKLLREKNYTNLVLKTSTELDLRKQDDVEAFFREESPEYVFLLAARAGGVGVNLYYPDLLYDNIMIVSNVLCAAKNHGVKKLIFVASACVYPLNSKQPINEKSFLGGKLEFLNIDYILSKIIGIRLCQQYNKYYDTNFIICTPNNLYGPGDSFTSNKSHVIPALINRFYEAKIYNKNEVIVFGTGNARREFIFVDDMADALIYLMQNYNENEIINIGVGYDISLKDLAYKIKELVGFEGKIIFDSDKPEGISQRLLDSSKLFNYGWHPSINLDKGLKVTYEYFLENTKK
ncbi:GDP-fucose synthetase [candidate division TM6 bacterium RIFCSPHIGHO2_12_FULL_32_22]|nr:MAG: GDP-fucose synthetase [candidate division TM6 bacterium RIFCSPHIGHO2_12_FULL_32_22]